MDLPCDIFIMAETLRPNEPAEPAGEPKEPSEEEILKSLGLEKGQRVTLSKDFWNADYRGKSGKIRGIDSDRDLVIVDENDIYLSYLSRTRFDEIKKHLIFEESPSGEQERTEIKFPPLLRLDAGEEKKGEPVGESEGVNEEEIDRLYNILGMKPGDKVRYEGEEYTVKGFNDEYNLVLTRPGGPGGLAYIWVRGLKTKEDLEREGIEILSGGEAEAGEVKEPDTDQGGEGERMEEELKTFMFQGTTGEFRLDLDVSQETLEKLGVASGQKVKLQSVEGDWAVCGVHGNGNLILRDSHGSLFDIKGPLTKEDLINQGVEFIPEAGEGKKSPMETGPRIEPIQEKAPKEEGERRGMRPKDAKKEMIDRQIGKITNLDRFKGETMAQDDRKNLEALITELQGDRTDYLIEQWLGENPNEREESSFGQDMPRQKKLELFMARAGESYLEKDDEWRQLASLAEDIRMSGGQLSYESSLLANFYLDSFQEKTAAELGRNPENGPLQARRDRISRTREALYKSLYKKEVLYNEEEAKRLALNDPRIGEDYQKFLNELNKDGSLQEKAGYAKQSSLTIAALETQGYVVKPLLESGGIWKLFKKEITGARYFKDGAEVYPSFNDFLYARQAFEKQKKEEFSGTYLPEKIRELKMNELSGLANINGEDFERLARDQENLVLAKIIEIKERARLKKEDPVEAKRYEEMSKDKGVNVKEGLKGAVEDWDEIGKYDENSFNFDRIFSRFGGAPEGDYASRITSDDKQSLLKSREKGPFSWMFSVMKLIAKLQQMTEIK